MLPGTVLRTELNKTGKSVLMLNLRLSAGAGGAGVRGRSRQ